MELLRQVGATENRFHFNDAGNMAVKLLRTYTAQLEALKRYRSAGEQRVVVQHQHVNVTADQAAVQVNGGAAPDLGGRGARGSIPCAGRSRIPCLCTRHPAAVPGPGRGRRAGSRR
jgi:hypothetical protein